MNCDGIFLNYTWTELRLSNSCLFAKELGRDIKDIYVGLDVWGRGCPGGGGFNSAYVNNFTTSIIKQYYIMLYKLYLKQFSLPYFFQ